MAAEEYNIGAVTEDAEKLRKDDLVKTAGKQLENNNDEVKDVNTEKSKETFKETDLELSQEAQTKDCKNKKGNNEDDTQSKEESEITPSKETRLQDGKVLDVENVEELKQHTEKHVKDVKMAEESSKENLEEQELVTERTDRGDMKAKQTQPVSERDETPIMEFKEEEEEEPVSERRVSDIPDIIVTSASPLLAELIENDSNESSTDSSESVPWSNIACNVERRDEKRKKEVVDAIGNVLAKRQKLNNDCDSNTEPKTLELMSQKFPISPQKENIKPKTNGLNNRKPRVFVIEDSDMEDIYVTDGNNMVSAKTGRLLQTFQNTKKNGNGLAREPGEIVNSKMEKVEKGMAAPEDYTWVTRVRELYGKLKLPTEITAELDYYWKNLDNLDENIARREVDLLELKGQKKWMVTMLARTLESYPIPGQNQNSRPVYNIPNISRQTFRSPQKTHSQRDKPFMDINYDPRVFYPVSPQKGSYPLSMGKINAGSGFQPISGAGRPRIEPNISPVRQWPTKPLPSKGVPLERGGSMAPPPAHIKNEETTTPGGLLPGPPPAHTGDRSYGIHRPVKSLYRQPFNEYWTSYFQAYQYEQVMQDKQRPPQHFTKPFNMKNIPSSTGKAPTESKEAIESHQALKDLSFKDKEKTRVEKNATEIRVALYRQLMNEGSNTNKDKLLAAFSQDRAGIGMGPEAKTVCFRIISNVVSS